MEDKKLFKDLTPEERYKYNQLARQHFINHFINHMYQLILFDMAVCELEGWDKKEFIRQIQDKINCFK